MIKKYQQGGASSQNELNQFAQEIIQNQLFGEDTETKLQQLAKEQPKIIQQLFQIWKQAGIDGVIKALSQSQKAARGAKLNRIKALNNACPEGYMKKGGKCKKCEKGKKFDKGAIPTTSYFKDGGIQKKQTGGGFNWAQAAQATAEAVGNGITAMYDWKKQKKYLDTMRDINNSNNNAQIAMAGAQNDLAMANMKANTELQAQQFINNNKRNRFTGYQPTWMQNQ